MTETVDLLTVDLLTVDLLSVDFPIAADAVAESMTLHPYLPTSLARSTPELEPPPEPVEDHDPLTLNQVLI